MNFVLTIFLYKLDQGRIAHIVQIKPIITIIEIPIKYSLLNKNTIIDEPYQEHVELNSDHNDL